jgi:hypothetical protein
LIFFAAALRAAADIQRIIDFFAAALRAAAMCLAAPFNFRGHGAECRGISYIRSSISSCHTKLRIWVLIGSHQGQCYLWYQ